MLSSVPGWKLFTIWHRNKYFKKVGNVKKKSSTCFIIIFIHNCVFVVVQCSAFELDRTALYSSKHMSACNCS